MSRTLYIRARIVWTVDLPPVADGALVVVDGTIRAVGRADEISVPAASTRVDLGEVIVLPGLVNAHCHLDYTHMAGQIAPTSGFTDWIKCITALKGSWSLATFRDSWLAGAAMSVRRGATTVADIEALPELLPDVWQATPLRVISFLEMTGVKSRRHPGEILGDALARAEALPVGRCGVGLSPHAPYSTVPELLRLSAAAARARGWRLATHVAESAEEYEMFTEARGTMYEWLARNERDMADCGGVSPVQHLARHDVLGANFLAVHANVLQPGDTGLLAGSGSSVVHCPRSHAYFQHRPFARQALERAGVNVCLGTDSLATVLKRHEPALDLFCEMREFMAASPGVAPAAVVRLATVNAARALGLAGRAGTLAAGAWADLIVVPYVGAVEATADAVVHHPGDVAASMIGGEWAVAPREDRAIW